MASSVTRRYRVDEPHDAAVGMIVKRVCGYQRGDAKTTELAVMDPGAEVPEIRELPPDGAYWWLQLYGDLCPAGVPLVTWSVGTAEQGESYPVVFLRESDCDDLLDSALGIVIELDPGTEEPADAAGA